MTVADFPAAGTIGATVKPKRYDIEMYKGDTFSFALKLMNASSVVIDMTGWTVSAQMKTYTNGVVGSTVSGSFTASTPNNTGVVSFTFDSTSLAAGDYIYDVQFTDTSAQKRTFIGGKVTVTADISA